MTTYLRDEGRRLALPGLLADLPPSAQVYACGPQRLIDELERLCADWPEDRLHVEHFSSTLGELDPRQEHDFDVEFKDSGLTAVASSSAASPTSLADGACRPSTCRSQVSGPVSGRSVPVAMPGALLV